MADLRVERLMGASLDSALPEVAKLRIEVFRDWPYLYDGDLEYEGRYLQVYRDSADAILVGAFDGERLVGASTGTPMLDHADDFSAAFAAVHVELSDIFYCAESVLLSQYRGHGVGHQFFDLREQHARDLGLSHAAFCAVIRPPDHPSGPADYSPLDPFWRSRGYAPLEGAVARFAWKDLGHTQETDHDLQFWVRSF